MTKKLYNSETGDVMNNDDEHGQPAIEPLRVPGVLNEITDNYIPAPDERCADEVWSMGMLRERLSGWLVFGAVEDVLQGYLEELHDMGYILQDTSSGLALCLIHRYGNRVVYADAEIVDESK